MRMLRRKKTTGKRYGRWLLLSLFMLIFMFFGCAKAQAQEESPTETPTEMPAEPVIITVQIPEGSSTLYYMNEERTKVINKGITLTPGTVEHQVAELLTLLEEELWTEEEKALLTDENPIREFKVDENGLLSLRFSADYSTVPSITDVLRRAAIVKTLCQLYRVNAVEFYIGTQPLLTSSGKPLGMLTADDFIDSTGENTEFYQKVQLSVYFANEAGNALLESNLNVSYDGTLSTEHLILQQLIEGPVLGGMQAVIPEGTTLNKVTIRDGICYVDFNEKFMEKRPGITPEVAVYSVVNSLTELSNVYRVQFFINGAAKKTYYNLDFSSAFERNLEIVEGEQ